MSFFGGPSSHSNSHSRPSEPQYYHVRPSAGPRSTSSFSFFSRPASHNGSSHYRRRPRDGYISYLIHKLKRLLLDLFNYARKHPVKAFLAVAVPLLSAGGAIGGLLRQFGVRLPLGLEGIISSMSGSRRYSGGYYGSRGYEFGQRSDGDGFGTIGNVLRIAQAFI
ncbi:hypothetical protein MBLNU457_1931t2 [Dothideomycetes sp. NU457]